MSRTFCLGLLAATPLVLSAGCSGNDEPPPPPPTVARLMVVNSATGEAVGGAHVLIDDTTWTAIGPTGTLEVELTPGLHAYRVVAGGFVPVPASLRFVPSFELATNQTTTIRIAVDANGQGADGDITGLVTKDGAPLPGAMVVTVNSGFVGFADSAGRYIIPGLPASVYVVEARAAGADGESILAVTVTAGAVTEGIDLTLTSAAGVSVTGMITGGTGTSSVALLDPGSRQAVPGLSVVAPLDGTYTITGVPPGRYILAAAFEPDAFVLDPEPIRTGGPPTVTVDAADVTQDFGVAPRIDGLSPVGTTTAAAPRMSWAPFSGADYYVVEVRDATGKVVWGGFDSTGRWRERVIGATNVVYGGPALTAGPRYSFRIFAALQNPVVGSDFDLIAASESLDGTFTIQR